LHRDVKPSNILLDDDDFAYLIDFGIARAVDDTRMTQSGNTIGTFAYIAPERLDSQAQEDSRADIYSLACVLYEALIGEPPFPGTNAAHLVAAHLNSAPPRPSNILRSLPRPVDEVIATGMAKNPSHRYATTVELANAAREAITAPRYQPAPSTPPVPVFSPAPRPSVQRLAQPIRDAQTPVARMPGSGVRRPTAVKVALVLTFLYVLLLGVVGCLTLGNFLKSTAPMSAGQQIVLLAYVLLYLSSSVIFTFGAVSVINGLDRKLVWVAALFPSVGVAIVRIVGDDGATLTKGLIGLVGSALILGAPTALLYTKSSAEYFNSGSEVE